MLKNYLIIALRNLLSNKLFSGINIMGLAIGLASCILILLFVQHELNFDTHVEDGDRIVRVTRNFTTNNLHLATVAPPIGPLLEQDFQEIEDMTRIQTANLPMSRGETRFNDSGFGFADANVFEFFGFELLEGDPDTALTEPFALVLTQTAADRFFGDDDPMGESLTLMGQVDLKVTGIMADLPENTHMQFAMLGSIDSFFAMFPEQQESWGSNNYYTYLRLPSGSDINRLEDKLPDFLDRHLGENARQWNYLDLQPLRDIHLHSNLDQEMKVNGSITTVYVFAAIALVILVIACINFMNLTTARSTQRAKEVGMRKVAGASRSELIVQFLGESILITAIAMLIALAMVEIALPWFASFVEKDLQFSYIDHPRLLALIAGGTVVVGVLAGAYPAFFLSAFRPASVLKGAAIQGVGTALVRRILVVVQFGISITLIIATIVVLSQLRYAHGKDLGYDREQNIVLNLPFQIDGSTYSFYPPMRDQLLDSADVLSVTLASRLPTGQLLDGRTYERFGQSGEPETTVPLRDVWVSYSFFDHFEIALAAGRGFDESLGDVLLEQPTEEEPVSRGQAVINELAASKMGFETPQAAIGQIIVDSMPDGQRVDFEVVGVARDFNFSSLHDNIRPTVFRLDPRYGGQVAVKIAPGSLPDVLDHIDRAWSAVIPDQAVNRQFLDDRFDTLYRTEERQAQVFGIFAALAILVAALGLFGLSSFTTERRTKEIGVRKVMGASVADIILLLTGEFSRLVMVANLVAWPVAWYLMSRWLERFAYAVELNVLWFVFAAVAALIVASLTVAGQAGKTALSRPAMSLRYE